MSDTRLKLEVLMAAVDKITKPLKAVLDGSQATSKRVVELRKELKTLQDQSASVAGFRALRRQTDETAHAMGQAQQRVDKLAREINAAERPSKQLTRSFEAAKREAAQLSDKHQTLSAKLQRERDALDKAGLSTQRLSQHQRRLKADTTAASAALATERQRLDEINARARKMTALRNQLNKTQAFAGKAAGVGASAAVGAGVAGAALLAPVKAYADLEVAATDLRVAMMGANGQVNAQFKQINDLAVSLGNKLPGNTADFQRMLFMLQRQGLSAERILGGVGKATAYLAVQLKKAPEDAAEFAAKMQDATRTTSADMLELMDVIQRSYYLGVDDNNMLQGFVKLSPVLGILRKEGLEATKALAPLLVMTDQAGMRGEASGNAYRKIFQGVMDVDKVGKANTDVLAGTGVRFDFTDGKGEFGGLDQMFAQLAQLKHLSTTKRLDALATMFGDDAETLQALQIMIDKGITGYQEVQARMQAQADLEKRVNEQLKTITALWDAASGTFTNALAAFGEAIAPEVKALTVWIGEISERLQQWSAANTQLSATIMKTIAVAGALLASVAALSLAVAGLLGPFAVARFAIGTVGLSGVSFIGVLGKIWTALKVGGTVFLWLGRLLLTNPIGLAVTGIATAAILIYTYWDDIKAAASAAWQWISDKAKAAADFIVNLFMNWTLPGLIIKHWDDIIAFMGGLPARMMDIGGRIVDGLTDGAKAKWEAAKQWFFDIGNTIADKTKSVLGIHSPSRVFQAIGGHITEGLTIGLNKGQLGPLAAAQRLNQQLLRVGAATAIGATAVAPALARPATAPATPVTINITVNAAPGADGQSIGQAVARELERAMRAHATAKRSRLSDD